MFFSRGFGHHFLNYIGATIRWIYGSIWRTIFKKPKFTYKEYLYGPNNSIDHFDVYGHQFNNKIIGMVTFGLIVFIFQEVNRIFF